VALSDDLKTPPAPKKEVLGKIATLLDRNGIDVDEVGRITRVSLYQSLTKNDEGEAEIHDLVGVQLSPSWEDGPQWDPVSQAPPVKCSVKPVKGLPKPEGWRTAVIVPDAQIGYYRDAEGELVSTHDEDAISLCLSMIRDLNPEVVVCVGDMLDAPEFGKYRLSPAFTLTTQASINRAATFAAELRACAPDAEIVWLAGNHEERITNAALDGLKAAFGLKRGNDTHGLPVLSVPFLCRFDDANIRYVPGYPAGNYWINEKIKVIHGNRVKSNGSTAHVYLANEKCSVIYGHIHRREWAERSRDDYDGAKTVMAASPGCLAKTNGAVPSTRGGIDTHGRPLNIVEDWQQGVGIVTFQPGDGNFFYEQIAIHDGQAWFRGKLYSVGDD
jgi:predicted phosphodiesterase